MNNKIKRSSTNESLEWAEIGPNRRLVNNLDELKAILIKEMDQRCKSTLDDLKSCSTRYLKQKTTINSISKDPLKIRIFSNAMPHLCIIDLPGIVKIPNKDQPDNIELITTNICQEYIKHSNSIILAVSPSTMELQTSESLKIARIFDPEGRRTIAVVTKVDLLIERSINTNDPFIFDRYFDTSNLKWLPTIIGCVCITKDKDCDTIDNIFDYSLEIEEKIKVNINADNHYQIGIKNLTHILQSKLCTMIRESLPSIKSFVDSLMMEFDQESHWKLNQITDPKFLLIQIADNFANIFDKIIGGQDPIIFDINDVNSASLEGASAIFDMLHNDFYIEISQIDSLSGITEQTLQKTILLSNGLSPRLFLPESAINSLASKQLQQLESPCFKLMDRIRKKLYEIVDESFMRTNIYNYPKLHEKLKITIGELIEKKYDETFSLIRKMIEIEQNHININFRYLEPNNFEYLGKILASHSNNENEKHTKLDIHQIKIQNSKNIPNSQRYSKVLEELLKNYVDTIKYKFHDTTIKTIMHCFIGAIRKDLRLSINWKLHCDDDALDLLTESNDYTAYKYITEKIVDRLNRLRALLN